VTADPDGPDRRRDANPSVTDPPARAGTRPAAVSQETPMTHERHFSNEDPAIGAGTPDEREFRRDVFVTPS